MFCKNASINIVIIIFAKNLEVHCFKRRRHKVANYYVPFSCLVCRNLQTYVPCQPFPAFYLFEGLMLWEVKTDIIQCIHLFSMLAISFYFVICVIISCKLSFNSRFTRNQIPIMSFLGFKKAELGCKMSELHL